MAATDITRAQVATLFGSALTAVAMTQYDTAGNVITSNTFDLRGRWCAFIGDDSGTPKLVAVGDTFHDLQAYIGPQYGRSVAETSNTGALFICYVPEDMA